MEKGGAQGFPEAIYNLGFKYKHGGRGITQSFSKAFRLWQKASDLGYADAQSNLGTMLYQGQGVARSYAEGARWFREAADQGNAVAQYNLGSAYYDGLGVVQSDVESAQWFQKAANQGNANAQTKVGLNFFIGKGVPEDLVASHKFLSLAADQGHEDAKLALKEIFAEGPPVCANCGIAASILKACTRCKVVHYCNRECQTAHWKAVHKKKCTPK